MRTYRNLCYALLLISFLSLCLILPFTQSQLTMLALTLLGIFIAVFAVSLVALIAALTLYFSSKSGDITVLKRRGGRVYGELLHHKVLLISAMDGDKAVADWAHYLYDPDEFPRIKKLIGEEYFLLLSCDSFFWNSNAAHAFNAFKALHEQLSVFIRSVSYDRVECAKFRKLYFLKTGKELTSLTPESEFEDSRFSEAYESLQSANEQALRTIDSILDEVEKLELQMDKYFTAGVSWATAKKTLEARYQVWLHATEV